MVRPQDLMIYAKSRSPSNAHADPVCRVHTCAGSYDILVKNGRQDYIIIIHFSVFTLLKAGYDRFNITSDRPQEHEVLSFNHPYSLKTKSSQCHYVVMTRSETKFQAPLNRRYQDVFGEK